MFRLRTFVTFFGGLVVLVFVSRPLLTTVHNRVGKLALGTIPASGSLLGTKQKTSKGSQPVNNEYGKPPIYFEPNLGQTDPQVKFMARGGGGTTFLTATEAVFSLPVGGHSRDRTSPSAKAGGGNPDPVPTLTDLIGMGGVGLGHRARDLALGVLDSRPFRREFQSAQSTIGNRQSAIRMKLVGANPETQIEGLDRLPGISNYFIGNDPAKWRRNIPHYAKVRYREVYPGIDMAYYGQQEQLEYDLIVAPGADPEVIEIAYEGAESMELGWKREKEN